MPREILTLQLGQFANHVGTHFWNLQEALYANPDPEKRRQALDELNPDILFREGLNDAGEATFTPRTLIFDARNAFGSLGRGAVQTVQQSLPPSSQFHTSLQTTMNGSEAAALSDKEAALWSNYSRCFFHPRSAHELREVYDADPSTPFDDFYEGSHLWRDHAYADAFEDNIRWFLEECDSAQGFQVLADCGNGFSGLTAGVLEYLQDEYSQKVVTTLACLPPQLGDAELELPVDVATLPEAQVAARHVALQRRATRRAATLAALVEFRELSHVLLPLSPCRSLLRQFDDILTLPNLNLQTPNTDTLPSERAFSSTALRGANLLSLQPTPAELQAQANITKLDTARTAEELLQRYLGAQQLSRQFISTVCQTSLATAAPFPTHASQTSALTVAWCGEETTKGMVRAMGELGSA
ncbi:uncharacterized protein MONBRDRAFT_4850, partial [Monosiga brevicollis MX1]